MLAPPRPTAPASLRRSSAETRPTTIPRVEEPRDFDLLAASLRADARDVDAFVEALATKLEQSFPDRVDVDRGGFLGGKRVRALSVELGDNRFELERERGRVECRRRNVVRGIALRNDELSLDDWIDDLSRRLVEEAGRSERARAALERLLGA
jgi:hypothetical protein